MSKGELLTWIKVNPSLELLAPELRALTAAEYGAHCRLRFQFWVGGCKALADDDAALATIAGCNAQEWERIKPAIMRIWRRKNRTIFHTGTRLEFKSAQHLHELRRNSARARHGKSSDINDMQGFADDVQMQSLSNNERTNGTNGTERTDATNDSGASADSGTRGPMKADVRPIRPSGDDGRRGDEIADRLADLVAALRQVGVPITDADAGMVERFAKAATEGPASIDGWFAERIAARKDSFAPSLCKARNVWGLMITDFERWQKGAA